MQMFNDGVIENSTIGLIVTASVSFEEDESV